MKDSDFKKCDSGFVAHGVSKQQQDISIFRVPCREKKDECWYKVGNRVHDRFESKRISDNNSSGYQSIKAVPDFKKFKLLKLMVEQNWFPNELVYIIANNIILEPIPEKLQQALGFLTNGGKFSMQLTVSGLNYEAKALDDQSFQSLQDFVKNKKIIDFTHFIFLDKNSIMILKDGEEKLLGMFPEQGISNSSASHASKQIERKNSREDSDFHKR